LGILPPYDRTAQGKGWIGEFSNFHGNCQYLSEIFPDYMDSAGKTGLWTAIPYASMWASSILFSLASDFLIRRKIISTAIVRKVLKLFSKSTNMARYI
jgi:hypothetical protein